MADVTGPISTLPGAAHAVPEGTMCDEHPDRPAVARIQGETDSMGCEMIDACAECVADIRNEGLGQTVRTGECDWCKKTATDLRPARDYDEGMTGPVYQVCGACIARRNERLEEEDESDDWDDDYDDDYDERGDV
ncbi:MAG: Uncharacterized protein JWO52_4095 [Gammaproteobacteria bacterium]|nr:Uncharacterized protein [Gammaproteobacteria bacterium]